MDKLKIKSINGDKIPKVVAGLVRIDERDNSCEMTPDTSGEAKNPINNKDYITIPLIPNKDPNKDPNKEINSEMEL